jgi:hypothetical protein
MVFLVLTNPVRGSQWLDPHWRIRIKLLRWRLVDTYLNPSLEVPFYLENFGWNLDNNWLSLA